MVSGKEEGRKEPVRAWSNNVRPVRSLLFFFFLFFFLTSRAKNGLAGESSRHFFSPFYLEFIRRLKGHVERCCIQPLPILSPG